MLKELPFEKDEFDVLVSTAVTTYLSKYYHGFYSFYAHPCNSFLYIFSFVPTLVYNAVYEVEVAFIVSISDNPQKGPCH